MKRVILLAFAGIFSCQAAFSQKTGETGAQRPKLVVGIVIDQMRWDYLYRFNPLFKATGGFKRMMGEGFSCDNTLIPYTPTVTACGHTCVYTGSVPAIHGITGNAWWDNQAMRSVYCSEDKTVIGVGSQSAEDGQMSPKNMLVTTVCDELRLASNFQNKVIGIAIKDRGAILPAGHSANAAYWYEARTGNFITSSWYMNELPAWVTRFNNRKLVDSLYKLNWKLRMPAGDYARYATEDSKAYEGRPLGNTATGFPYDLTAFAGKDYGKISSTPWGNTLTVEMAKAAVAAEQLGKGNTTDFLAVSFSSPDYVGHAFGPNSIEQVDDYIRLDDDLGRLFAYLDATVGKGQYTAFLTADHAVAHVPGFMKEHKLPAGLFDESGMRRSLNAKLKSLYGIDNLVVSTYNYQLSLNHPKIDSAKLDEAAIKKLIIDTLKANPAVANAFATADIMTVPIAKTLREMLANGYYPARSGDVQLILKPGYIEGGLTGTTHGAWYPYDAHIPLLWYGWGIKKGNTKRETYMTDIAPTVAGLLNIQMPSGSVGKVIEEVMK
ncbi:alkaline phosphatase PafA [Sediminibacterium soli]|uniref:alkaline phosphatase PafA n=1 Tax=Sediminibacterium soli TaxID=2698829 RepID=UPI00137B8F46|nr:alkaline phosphatase PafA [Sediminibacterium soli]NCI45994.1 alkaline phosphatase family protein [Sediminibacterium soli]